MCIKLKGLFKKIQNQNLEKEKTKWRKCSYNTNWYFAAFSFHCRSLYSDFVLFKVWIWHCKTFYLTHVWAVMHSSVAMTLMKLLQCILPLIVGFDSSSVHNDRKWQGSSAWCAKNWSFGCSLLNTGQDTGFLYLSKLLLCIFLFITPSPYLFLHACICCTLPRNVNMMNFPPRINPLSNREIKE